MTAAVLRKAATLMRERAEMATPSPWRDSSVDGNRYGALVADKRHPDRRKGGGWDWDEGYGGCLIGESLMAADRRHISSWHPAVALAVADWLDFSADVWADGQMSNRAVAPALAVAHAYLGADEAIGDV